MSQIATPNNLQKHTSLVIEHETHKFLEILFNNSIHDEIIDGKKLLAEAENPKLGDHLVKPRPGYTHHGIYVGDGMVIHYAGFADGFSSAPVEKVTLLEFHGNNGSYSVQPHRRAKFPRAEVVQRAHRRLGEDKYNLVFNNCEHFVNWCIYDIHISHQVTSATTAALAALPNTRIAASLTSSVGAIKGYLSGKIDHYQLLTEVSRSAINVSSAAYYTTFGQIAIPIPLVGALAGATVGYFLGNLLNQSGMISLGEADIVHVARKRREKIEAICNSLIEKIDRSREELEFSLNKYFQEGSHEISMAMDQLHRSLATWDVDKFSSALSNVAYQVGQRAPYASFHEFETAIRSKNEIVF